MKKYLIDTHIFLWLVFDPEKVNTKKLEILKDPQNKIFIANISFWEISLKYNLGKLNLSGLTPDELPKVAQKMGIDTLEIEKEVMASFYKLPKVQTHKDPFDRIIIWQCINDNITLISQDRKFSEYESFGLKTF
ncbi:type II toxin-antitoxin system VapC family toxin [Hydrogenimonas thermophila]|uniref:type II toxin-antitoxin system VapC family toxin n=1 Tax=Hydrogenimonas thermophila TaxID=223786 RepID=UPI002936D548|nr:type II toxin-antitoxin system VapC family toxin [Hydrogenimonas thermophila]WOE69200.1 type II toxin-antitoxin system VapC family toxin [Hydrogenimonas thermophila]WOE71710.1 type II toxin-antitoxin system VapC family toxin [Hydrogenimonas thermophila]